MTTATVKIWERRYCSFYRRYQTYRYKFTYNQVWEGWVITLFYFILLLKYHDTDLHFLKGLVIYFKTLRVIHILSSPATDWQQVFSRLQDSSQYYGWSQQYCSLDDLCLSSDFQLFQSLYQTFNIPSAPNSIGITVTLIFHGSSSFLIRYNYLSLFSFSWFSPL